jgi:tetratricopeptide (TPR) repeat protein
MGNALMYCRFFQESLEHYRKATTMLPEYASGHGQFGLAYLGRGMFREAAEEFRIGAQLNPQNFVYRSRLSYARAKLGYRDSAVAILNEVRKRGQDPSLFTALSELYMSLGAHDSALAYFAKAVDSREALLDNPFTVIWDPVRADPRFQAAIQKMGLPSER